MLNKTNKRTHKFNASKTTVDGIEFDSKLEARVYSILKLHGFKPELQKTYELQPGFIYEGKKIRPITYNTDFTIKTDKYEYVLDAKGLLLPEAKLKAKIFTYTHNNSIIYVNSETLAHLICEWIKEGRSPSDVNELIAKRKKERKKNKSKK